VGIGVVSLDRDGRPQGLSKVELGRDDRTQRDRVAGRTAGDQEQLRRRRSEGRPMQPCHSGNATLASHHAGSCGQPGLPAEEPERFLQRPFRRR